MPGLTVNSNSGVSPPALVPDGISHSPNLATLTPEQRRAHHTQRLRSIAFQQGLDGVSAYVAAHPDAEAIRVSVNALAYAPKPKGYDAAILDTVTRWLSSPTALSQSNSADVGRLNNRLGTTRFNPANHFSKPLSAALLAKVRGICAEHGAALPQAKGITMARIKQCIRTAKVQGGAGAQPFGAVGTRSGDTLTIGERSFTISRHGNRECIWVTADGVKQRICLAALAALFPAVPNAAGPGDASNYLLRSRKGDRHQTSECAAILPANEGDVAHPPLDGRTSPSSPHPLRPPLDGRMSPNNGDDPPADAVTFRERITRLASALRPAASAFGTDRDPLELDPLELA